MCAPQRPLHILDGHCCHVSLQSSPFTITFSPVRSFKKVVWTPPCQWWGTTEHCCGGYRGWRATFTGWEYMLLFKSGRLLKQMETALKNNYAFISVVMKFSDIFTRPSCTWYELKNGRRNFLITPCLVTHFHPFLWWKFTPTWNPTASGLSDVIM